MSRRKFLIAIGLVFLLCSNCFAYDANTKLLAHFNGTTGDTPTPATTGQTLTYNGGAAVSTATTEPLTNPPDTAVLLVDGTGDYVTVPDSADWDLGAAGSGDFTIDFWMNMNVQDYRLIATYSGAVPGGWTVATDASGLIGLRVEGAWRWLSWTGNTGQWYHVAWVRSGGTITCYIDGTSLGTVTDGNMNGGTLGIGGSPDGSGLYNGYIDEVRISNTARWTSNFTRPTNEYNGATVGRMIFIND